MSPVVFSDAWAQACARAMAASDGFSQAARDWRGLIVLRLTGDHREGDRRVLFHLRDGTCHEARAAGPEDEAAAAYVLDGSLVTWREVLSGGLAPLVAVLSGRLTLVKGSLAALVPHAAMARELAIAATTIDTRFPEP